MNTFGKLSKLQFGQAPREMTKRQSWVYQQMGFINTSTHESHGLLLILYLETSVLRENRSQPILSSTPVSSDSRILDHFDQMKTLISGFLQQRSDRQPSFFDYVASEAEKTTQEEFEDFKGRMFRDIEAVKNTNRRQVLPKRSATITKASKKVGILPPSTHQASSSTQAPAGSSWLWKPSISCHTRRGQ